jgi:GNAT superfamily N-acetyltransferase
MPCYNKKMFFYSPLAALPSGGRMTNNLGIRLMRPGEEGEVGALVARVFNDFVALDFPPEGIDEFYRYAQPSAIGERSKAGSQVLVAEEGSPIVGMLELRGSNHIAMLFVEKQGRGVGRRLVERVLQTCGNAPGGTDTVTVHASRYAAPIYRQFGFEAERSRANGEWRYLFANGIQLQRQRLTRRSTGRSAAMRLLAGYLCVWPAEMTQHDSPMAQP